jgi:PD-(D/E)XK endonuclease
MFGSVNPRRQGDLGEFSAIEWLGSRGYPVWVPIGHSPDCDMVTEIEGQLARVQVKTSTVLLNRRFHVSVCTRGGNQSWNGLVKRFSPERCDWLFVLVADGRRWFIPAKAVAGSTKIGLGGPQYTAYEVESGRPLTELLAA